MYNKFYYIIFISIITMASACSEQQPASIDNKSISKIPSAESKTDKIISTNNSDEYQEKLHYSRINPAQPTQSKKDRIEVIEMFFYACPHCYKLEPTIEKWLNNKADDVDFIRVPAIIGPTWAEQAKAYYIAEKLGIGESVRKNLFDSIHKDGEQYYNEYTLMTFFKEQGVDENRFNELYQSAEIMEKTSEARVKTVRYGIRGVPAIIVNGEYYTATYFNSNHKEMLKIVDYLIGKVRNEKHKKAEQLIN